MGRGNFLIYAAFLIGSFLILKTLALAATSDIVINEIGAHPTSTHEWIELWNRGPDPVDIRGWKLWENTTNHAMNANKTDSVLDPGEYAAVVQDDAQFMLDNPNFAGSVFDSTWSSLSENGEEIGLKDSGGNIIEQFVYVPIHSYSLERRDPYLSDYTETNWQASITGTTLGSQNSIYTHPLTETSQTTTTTSTTTAEPLVVSTTTMDVVSSNTTTPDAAPNTGEPAWQYIKINEFMADPDDGSEWIELYNTTSSAVDLLGSTLCDNRATSCTIAAPTNTVAGFGWIMLFLDGAHLNNSGDSIIFKDPNGTTIDTITYGGNSPLPKSGQTLARILDGADTNTIADWAVTTNPTPGGANNITAPPNPTPALATNSYEQVTTPVTTKTTTPSSTKTTIKSQPKEEAVHVVWDIKMPPVAAPNEPVTFSAGASADPRGGLLLFHWDFGDSFTAEGATTSHVFAQTGTAHIIVSATSSAGTVDSKTVPLLIAPGLSAADSSVIINEVYPNPDGADSTEFIELYNAGSSAIDLSGWHLSDSSEKTFTIPNHTTISPDSYLTFYRLATKISLDNNRDTVTLTTPADTIVDRVVVSKGTANQSYNRAGAFWTWSATSTPGAANIVPDTIQVLGEKIVATSTKKTVKKIGKPTATSRMVTAAGARELTKGTPVHITGVVTVKPKEFSTQYFYLNDTSAGIQVYSAKKNFPPLETGDVVRVAGTMSIAYGVPRVLVKQAAHIQVTGHNQSTTPLSTSIGEIDDTVLGLLVAVTGEITELKSNYVYLDDGENEMQVYFKSGAHIDKKALREGDRLTVVGIVEQNNGVLQLWPRSNSDITIHGPDAQAANQNHAAPVVSKNNAIKKYVVASSLGMLALTAGWLLKKRTTSVLSKAKS